MSQSIKYTTRPFPNLISETTGFFINTEIIIKAIEYTNRLIAELPKAVYSNIDYKATSGLIGACFCTGISLNSNNNAIVNPNEKGYPDIIPTIAITDKQANLMNYPKGIEVKCTSGSVSTDSKIKKFSPRLEHINQITWQAHHRDGKHLLGVIWDFIEEDSLPVISGVFYSNQLKQEDWGKISGISGRNTKVCSLLSSGKKKMGDGWIAIIENPNYKSTYLKKLTGK